MLALAGKVLFGLSLGMASSFVLGATSVGLWALAWPAIVLTGSVGAAFWLIGKATQSPSSGGSGGPEDSKHDFSKAPPPYEDVTEKVVDTKSKKQRDKLIDNILDQQDEQIERIQKKIDRSLEKQERASAPAPSIFVTPPHFSFSTPVRTVHRGATVLPSSSTIHPRVASRVEVRTTAPRLEAHYSAGGAPLMAAVPRATTVRHVGTRSVRVR